MSDEEYFTTDYEKRGYPMTSKPDARELGIREILQQGDYLLRGDGEVFQTDRLDWGKEVRAATMCRAFRPSRPECTEEHGQAEKKLDAMGFTDVDYKYAELYALAERMKKSALNLGLLMPSVISCMVDNSTELQEDVRNKSEALRADLAALEEWKRGNHASEAEKG